MPVNPNWTRWIVASITKHFSDALTGSCVYLQIDETDRRTDRLEDYAELRHDGPRYCELSKGYWQIEVDLDVLVCSKTNDKNGYTPEVDVGVVLAAFTTDIPVFQYGSGPADDPDVQLGCLLLDPQNGCVDVINYGAAKDQVRLRQAAVEARYRMNLSTQG